MCKPEDIEKVFQRFYKSAANEEEVRTFLEQLDLPSVGAVQNERLTADITREEIIKAIYSVKNNESPESDGYPAEWYKVFKKS